MRDRRQPRSNLEPCSDELAAPMARLFAPSELDLDDLAEAIRSLLEPTSQPQTKRPNRDLLSFPHRGTHVVEANEIP